MWKFWLVGFLVIGAAFTMELANGVLNVYRAAEWRKSRGAKDAAQ